MQIFLHFFYKKEHLMLFFTFLEHFFEK